MPEPPAYGIIDRGLRDLSALLEELGLLCRTETEIGDAASKLLVLSERVTFEERALRTRFLLTSTATRRIHVREAQLAAYTSLAMTERREHLAERFRSAQELARSMEEYFHFFRHPRIADFYHRLRFELYDVERAASGSLPVEAPAAEGRPASREPLAEGRVRRALAACPLYFILDESLCEFRDPLRVGLDAVAGGVRLMQLRFKRLGSRELLALARKLKSISAERDCLLIINDRLDIALLAGADGVHVGAEDVSPEDIRLQAPQLIIGATARDQKTARAAAGSGATYIGAGSVFASPTKAGLPVISTGGLGRIAAAIDTPVVGIGGITPDNCQRVLAAGAVGFCSIMPFRARRSVRNLVTEFRAAAQRTAERGAR